MSDRQKLIKRIDLCYEKLFNEFKQMYERGSDQQRRRYLSNLSVYTSLLEDHRLISSAKEHFEKEIALDKWQQKAFAAVLLALSLLAMIFGEGYMLLALSLVAIYLSYEVKQQRTSVLLNSKIESMASIERQLKLIGPPIEHSAVQDWQNSFDVRSEFYKVDTFGSLASFINKEIALLNIKRELLKREVLRHLYINETLRLREELLGAANYESYETEIPPSRILELIGEESHARRTD